MKHRALFLFTAALAVVLSTTRPAFTQATNTFPTTGDAGIGTTSPTAPLDIRSTVDDAYFYRNSTDIYAPILRFRKSEGTIASPTVISNGDTSAALSFEGYDGSNYQAGADIYTVVNGTVASGSVPTDLVFNTGTSVSNAPERMRITSTGNVGIGTSSPNALFEVYSNNSTNGYGHEVIESDTNAAYAPTLDFVDNRTGASGHEYQLIDGGLASAFTIKDLTANTFDLTILGNGDVGIGTTSPSYPLQVNGTAAATSFYTTSDLRLKTGITPLAHGLDALMKLHPVGFYWKNQDQEWKKQRQIGLIAQQVETVVPEVVTTATDDMGTKSIAYGSLVPVLIEAIQEQQHEIDQLKKTLQQTSPTMAALHQP